MAHDNANVLGKMFELTTIRLARKALAEGNITLEGYTRNKITDLEKQMKAIKGSGEIQDQVKAVYETYGKSGDLKAINNDLNSALSKGQKACYWSKSTRLMNDQVSAFVLAVSASDKNAGVTDADAATLWAVEKIRKGAASSDKSYDPNSKNNANANLMNVSNRVARYLGALQNEKTNSGAILDGKSSSKADLDQLISTQEKEITDMIPKAYAQVKVSLYQCIDDHNKSCASCAASEKVKFEENNLGLDQIQRSLMQAVAKSENVKMEASIKGKIGEIDFDFNETLAKGEVAQAPERMNKFDACGHPKVAKAIEHNNGGKPKEVVVRAKPTKEFNPTVIDKTYVAPNQKLRYPAGSKIKPEVNSYKDLPKYVDPHQADVHTLPQ